MDWPEKEQSSFWKSLLKLVTHNGWLKLLSIVFSIILFMVVRSEQVKEYGKTAKLRIITADEVMVVGPSERAIDVRVRPPNTLFSRPPTDDELVGVLDVSAERIGKIRVKLGRENFPALDKRYQLIIDDSRLEIELDKVERKRVPVRPVLQGTLPSGIVVEKWIAEPGEVEILGPRRELEKIDMLSTAPINIENATISLSVMSHLMLDNFPSVKVSDDRINVQVIVSKENVTRVFRNVKIEALTPYKVELRPAAIDIELRGQKEVIEALKANEVRAFIDIESSEGSLGWHEKKVLLKIPWNTSLVSITPDVVSVQVIK